MGRKSKTLLRTLMFSSAISLASPLYVQAEEAVDAISDFEEIVTVGTRRKGRTVTESLAPVDVFNAETLAAGGYTDLNDTLRTLVPSFNIKRNATNDGTMLVRPFTMKGAPPDHVLLLLNGKRRHKSALVQLSGGYNTVGSQGPDFGQLPTIAFKDIQILRDGAAAQYGSDAIAGVVNLTMRDAREGGTITASYGQFYEGDGEDFDISANIGLALTENGFLNLSAQYVNQSKTDRAIQRANVQPIIDRGVDVADPVMGFGNPDNESIKLAWNGGIELSDNLDAYFFGNFSKSDTVGNFWYRNPDSNSAFGNSEFDESPEHPGVFDLATTYPGGFTPIFGADVTDFSQIVGLRGEMENEFSWDASLRYGRSNIDYKISNTINPSLGNESPTEFKPGTLTQREMQANLDLSYPVKNDVFFSDLVISGGIEWKEEAYIIGAGDAASYAEGPLLDLPNGSNGFQGYSSDLAGTFKRNNFSAYVDFETDLTEKWSIGVAGRYEDYSDFGDTANFKLSTRYAITEEFAVRATISSGFRAPSVGQLYSSSLSTDFTDDDEPQAIISGLFPTASDPAVALGAEPLGPESSTNYSAGFVYSSDAGFSLTVDFYQIDVSDRLLLAGPFTVTDDIRATLVSLNVTNAQFLNQVRYFQNQFDTRTRGVDVVATYSHDWANESSTDFMLAWNYNDQKLTKYDPAKFGVSSKKNFEDGVPASKGNLTIIHNTEKFSFMVRGNYYGTAFQGKGSGNHLEFKPALLLDLMLTYHLNDDIDVSLSGRNILDKYPGSYGAEAWGLPYWSRSPYGYNGGFYSAKITYNF